MIRVLLFLLLFFPGMLQAAGFGASNVTVFGASSSTPESTASKPRGERFIVVQAALKTGMPEIALAELKKMDEHDADYWLYMGQVQRQLRDPKAAAEAFTKVIKTDPDRAAGYDGLGMAYGDAGDPARGEAYLKKATELAPMEPTYYHDYGKLYLMQQRYAEARKPLAIALRLGGGAEVAKHLAMAMTLTGDVEQAKTLLMQYFVLKEVYCNLGEAFELGGDIPEAVKYYRLALLADRDYKRAQERLANLIGGAS